MNWLRNKKTVAVHSGNFHADEIFSVAALSLFLKEDIKIIRTREEKDFSRANYVIDVGLEYDPAKNRFDHHQLGVSNRRENSVPYASFGLIWKEFGEKISGSKEVADEIEKKLVLPVDSDDNGFEICKSSLVVIGPYTVINYIDSRNRVCDNKNRDFVFKELVTWAKDLIKMEIEIANKNVSDRKKIKDIYFATEDKRIIILDDDYDWEEILSEYPEPVFVIKPSSVTKTWKVFGVKVKGERFKNRLDLPESWVNKKGYELIKLTGVPDALYCHHQRYMAMAGSKDGAIKLAKLALKDYKNK